MAEESERVAKDVPKYSLLLNQIGDEVDQLANSFQQLRESVRDGKLQNHTGGLELISLKNECMAFYLCDLLGVVGCQLSGVSIAESALVKRLIEQRIVLERLRPLEDKLEYKIDKLLKMATNKLDSNDPLKSKPNFESNLDIDSEEGESEDESSQSSKKPGIYIAPKLRPVHPDDESRNARKEEKKRIVPRSVLRDAIDGSDPEEEETNVLYGKMAHKQIEAKKHVKRYEEENLTRVQLTKSERHAERNAMRKNELDSITHFGNTSALTGEAQTKKRKGPKFAAKKRRKQEKEKMKP